MEHSKYDKSTLGLDIVSLIEEKVKEMAKETWDNDDCPPEFLVSLNNEDPNNQSIMIDCNHNRLIVGIFIV